MKKKIKKSTLKIIALFLLVISSLMLFGGCQLTNKGDVNLSVSDVVTYYDQENNSSKINLNLSFDNRTIWNIVDFCAGISFANDEGQTMNVILGASDLKGDFFVRHGRDKTFSVEFFVDGNAKEVVAYNLKGVSSQSFWQTYKAWYIAIFCFFGELIVVYTVYVFVKGLEFGEVFAFLDDYGIVGTIIVVLLLGTLVLLFLCEWVNFVSVLLAIIVTFVTCWFVHYIQAFVEFLHEASLNRKEKKLEKTAREKGEED